LGLVTIHFLLGKESDKENKSLSKMADSKKP
jgi:hypothetical protein